MRRLLLIAIFSALQLAGESKTEAALRVQHEQLAKVQADLQLSQSKASSMAAELAQAKADLAAANNRNATAAANNSVAAANNANAVNRLSNETRQQANASAQQATASAQQAQQINTLTTEFARKSALGTKEHNRAVHEATAARQAVVVVAADAQHAAVAAEQHNDKAVENADEIKAKTERIKEQNDALLRATESSRFAMYATLGTGVLTFLTVLVGLIFKDRSDKRALEITVSHRKDELEKIEQVGAKADKAYEVGNTVNTKLENIGVRMADGLPLSTHEASPSASTFKANQGS